MAYDRRGHGRSDVPALGYDADRVARVVLLAPTTPMLLNTAEHPFGLTTEMIDGALTEFAADRAQ